MDALEAQVKHVFDLADRAVEHAQTIGGSRREIEETYQLLQETHAQLKSAEESLHGFEARRRQLERTEQRLARAEALALEVRSTVDSLPGPARRGGARDRALGRARASRSSRPRPWSRPCGARRTLACESARPWPGQRESDEEN